jgi:predicted nucleotidyltransferase
MSGEIEGLRTLARSVFEGRPGGPYSVYLYGSRAAGLERPDSDYDFAIAAAAPIGKSELEAIREDLADALPGAPGIDCVDLRASPLTLAAQVLESGIVLFPGDDYERAMLETRLMSMYAILNEERQGIIDDIVARGSVYGR